MREALTPIAGIPGVIGAALFAADDRCVVSALIPPYEDVLVERVMRTLRQALITLNVTLDSEATWSGLFLRCDGGHLVLRRIGEMVMLVFGHPTMNVAMVNVGLNVAALKLQVAAGSGLAQAPVPAAPMGSGPIPRAASQTTTTSRGVPVAIPPAPSGPTAGSAARGTQPTPSFGWPTAPATAAGAVPRATLEQVLRALARHLGPPAQVMMLDELVALGFAPNTVPFASYSELIDRLAAHVPDQERRTAFLFEAELVGIHTAAR